MKRISYLKILDFAKIPAILVGVFLLLKWVKSNLFARETKPINLIPNFGKSIDAEGIAEMQQQSMHGFIDLDKEDLFNSLENLSNSNLKRVFKAFGKRKWLAGGSGVFGMGTGMDLFGWYAKELSKSQKIRMREIWKNSGLEITF